MYVPTIKTRDQSPEPYVTFSFPIAPLSVLQIAKQLWFEAGATILDGQPALRLRPDGHRSEMDCLHYSLPGPPDIWALLIYNALAGRIV